MANSLLILQIQATQLENWVVNSFPFSVLSDPGVSPLECANDLANGFQAAMQTAWLDALGDDYLLAGYQCRVILDGGGPQYLLPTPGITGTQTDSTDLSIVGGIIEGLYQDPESLKYRRNRITMPGAYEGAVSNNRPSSGYTTQLDAIAAILGSPVAGTVHSGSYQFCALKRKKAPTPPVVMTLSDVVSSGHIGVLRKRERPQV